MINNFQEEIQYKEALLKYANAYLLKKKKSKNEIELEESERLYVIYARRSTEDEKRQVESVENQIEICQKFALNNNLKVVDIVPENKSAKIAGKRKQFNLLVERLKAGEFNSILAWHPDRLSRNMKESGEILDMLDNNIIADLKFPSYVFNNDAAGKMTLSILFAMAKEFSDKLSEDTKRGNRKKVSAGKHIGTDKRGYMKGKENFYIPHPETFGLYQKAWKIYRENTNQNKVAEWLEEQGETISVNMMSEFFRDPFSAGIYCYGDQVVDLQAVDPKFKPLITPKEFILMQKINRDNPRGWHISDEFRPFNDLIYCSECRHFMTAGVSKGKIYRYLNLTCGNRICKEKRINEKKTPISNTIRGETIKEFVKEAILKLKDVPESVYLKAKSTYFKERSSLIKTWSDEMTLLKTKVAKLESNAKKNEDSILVAKEPEIIERFSNNLKIILSEKREVEKELSELEQKKREYEYQMEEDFPPYTDFLNFFENALLVVEESENIYLIDQIVKLVFLNLTATDKKISGYCLREPFNEYETLKILNGVADGT